MRALWVYCILRDKSYDDGGYSIKTRSIGGLSKTQTYKYISILTNLGWITSNKDYYKITSMKKIVSSLGLKGRSAVEITPDCLKSFKDFDLHCMSAQVESIVRMQHNMTAQRIKSWKDTELSEFVDLIRSNSGILHSFEDIAEGVFMHKEGQVSLRVIAKYTGRSVSAVQRRMQELYGLNYIHRVPEYVYFASTSAAEAATGTFPNLFPCFSHLYAPNGALMCGVRVADTLRVVRTWTKKRFNVPKGNYGIFRMIRNTKCSSSPTTLGGTQCHVSSQTNALVCNLQFVELNDQERISVTADSDLFNSCYYIDSPMGESLNGNTLSQETE
jgi:DNA-binding Lrp family transcriptional regulator